jgi:hypothetical protein
MCHVSGLCHSHSGGIVACKHTHRARTCLTWLTVRQFLSECSSAVCAANQRGLTQGEGDGLNIAVYTTEADCPFSHALGIRLIELRHRCAKGGR